MLFLGNMYVACFLKCQPCFIKSVWYSLYLHYNCLLLAVESSQLFPPADCPEAVWKMWEQRQQVASVLHFQMLDPLDLQHLVQRERSEQNVRVEHLLVVKEVTLKYATVPSSSIYRTRSRVQVRVGVDT